MRPAGPDHGRAGLWLVRGTPSDAHCHGRSALTQHGGIVRTLGSGVLPVVGTSSVPACHAVCTSAPSPGGKPFASSTGTRGMGTVALRLSSPKGNRCMCRSEGSTLEFLLSPIRNARAAKSFFAKALAATHTSTPRVITVDKNAAYPQAFKELKAEEIMPSSCELRQRKYLNTIVEQDHRAHQTACEARDGLLFVRDCMANLARL